MAAKKKSDQGNEKPKGRPNTKKQSPKAKPEQNDGLDDDFGLDDIELDPVDAYLEETQPKSKPSKRKKPAQKKAKNDKEVTPSEDPKKETPILKEEKEKPEPLVSPAGDKVILGKDEIKEKSVLYDKIEEKEITEKVNKKSGGILFLVIILLAVLAVFLYYFIFKSDEPKPVEKAPIEQAPKPVPEQESEQTPKPVPVQEPESIVNEAQLYNLSRLEGNYYVIIGSFFDEDMAEDKAKAVVANGRNAYLIEPSGDFNFHRVGIGQSASLDEAIQRREDFIEEFGETIWVIKF